MQHRLMLPLVILTLVSGSRSFVAAQQDEGSAKPHLVIIIAEDEYKTDQTLPPFAKANLASDFRLTVLQADEEQPNNIPGLKAIATADVILISVRRRPLPPDQLEMLRKYVQQGKPIVAIRTSCHAFCLRNQPPPQGLADWPEFDPAVLGGHYVNHYGNDVQAFVTVNPKAADHPTLKGIRTDEFPVYGSLYRCQPLADSTTLLMTGRAEGIEPLEPVTWINHPPTGNRVFYTSLGHPQDFKIPDFVRLLRNGIYWAAGRAVPETAAVPLQDPPEK